MSASETPIQASDYPRALECVIPKVASSANVAALYEYLNLRLSHLNSKVWTAASWDSYCAIKGQREECLQLRQMLQKVSELLNQSEK